MIEYTKLLHTLIGLRIRNYRKTHKMKQTEIDIDNSTLSKIEHGIIVENKNRDFINKRQIGKLLEVFEQTTATELIWGNEQDKELFLKLIIIAILLNEETKDKRGNDFSPFYCISFEEWVRKEWNYMPQKIEQILNNSEEAIEKYGFFINETNYKFYDLLNTTFSEDYEMISNLILQQLNHDYRYSKYFYRHLINYANNTFREASSLRTFLENFVSYKGSYAVFILDKNGIDYPQFIRAFNKFWDSVKADYISYFNHCISIFDDTHLKANGLKYVTNDFFREAFTSNDFIKLNQQHANLLEHTNTEATISSLNMRLEFISAIQQSKKDINEDDIISDTISATKGYLDSSLKSYDFTQENE